jgi:transcriptional regulator with XRE-family HTH domain
MPIHIGQKIKGVVEKRGMTVSEFGRRINKSRENIYSIFKRKSIDTTLLEKISEVLEHNFFQYHYKAIKNFIEKAKSTDE